MGSRAGRRLNAATQVVLLAAILVVLNFLLSRHFLRADLTREKEYTLAPASRAILGGLQDIVTVDVYFSRNLPPYLGYLTTRVRDLLDEYRAYGGQNLKVNMISPDDDPATEQKMRMLGIPRVQLNVLDKDQFQVTQVYLGLTVMYRTRKEAIPVIQEVENLEYKLSAAIAKVARDAPLKVAFTAGGEGGDLAFLRQRPSEEFGLLKGELEEQYGLTPADPAGEAPLPADLRVLVLAGPRELSDRELYRLDQFVMGGGRLIVLADAFDFAQGSLDPRPVRHNLERLLAAWGLSLGKTAVLDARYGAPASFSSGFMRFRIPYPWWPLATPGSKGLDGDHPVTGRLEALVMPWTSPLQVAEPLPPSLKATVLARSSAKSRVVEEPFDFTPAREADLLPQGKEGASPLAVLVEGSFRSAFTPETIPADVPAAEREAHRREGPATAVLVTGTSRFARDNFVEQFPTNGVFVMNAVDYLAQGQDLIGIRSRGGTERPLPPLSDQARDLIRYANIFLLAGVVLAFGLVRLTLRKHAARRLP
jgi:gliding-associated putative ABC transporter substrate-binding component GldG